MMHELEEQVLDHSKALNESGDCAVRAIAMVTGVHYVDVHGILQHYGRKHRRGTYNYMEDAALERLGFVRIPVRVQARTVRTLGREFHKREGKYLVWVSRHLLAIVDGKVMDWSKGRLNRIKKVEEIVSKAEALRRGHREENGRWTLSLAARDK